MSYIDLPKIISISVYDKVTQSINQIYYINALTDYVDICTIKTVFDLLDCRDSICTVKGFTMSNIYALLEELTTGD